MNLFRTAIIAVFATVLRKSRNGEETMKRRHGLHYSWRLAMLSAVAFLTMAAASSTANAQPIVGLWEVTVTLTGQPVLNSFETWSSDGLSGDRNQAGS